MVLYILLLFKYIFLALFYFRFSNFRTLYQLVESNPSFISALSIKKNILIVLIIVNNNNTSVNFQYAAES